MTYRMLSKLAVTKGMIQHLVLLVDHLGRGLLKSKASKLEQICPTQTFHFSKRQKKSEDVKRATLELVWSFLASTTLNFT